MKWRNWLPLIPIPLEGPEMKSLALVLVASLALTVLTMLLPYAGCVCGDNRGLPFAIVRPLCGSPEHHVHLDDRPKSTQTVFDYSALAVDILIWTVVVFLSGHCFQRFTAHGSRREERPSIPYQAPGVKSE